MHLSMIEIENFRCFGEGDKAFKMTLQPGLTALVGENDSGKTAIIDALRFALGTTDQEWHPLDDDDFNTNATSPEIRIVCKFENLDAGDKRAFVEYLTYGTNPGDEPTLYVNWMTKSIVSKRPGRPFRRSECYSGAKGDGPQFDPNARSLLQATYLRPLRDVEQALSAGRKSRLAQVLLHSKEIREGTPYDISTPLKIEGHELSIPDIAKVVDALLEEQKGIKQTRATVDKHLTDLVLKGEEIASSIEASGKDATEDIRIRRLLEKLDLTLGSDGKSGLGSNNLLFIACELLLLTREEGNRLLLIEEPEAHLHAQRQLRAMKFLQDQATDQGVQIIVTTHSPNLASAIDLNNIVMIHDGRAFSMAQGETALEPEDYRFLQRFLDVTKSNLFFARGVMIVEGDAESILLPTLARLIDRDFTEHGVSIVNVGGIGLRRYARIFQQTNLGRTNPINIPIACVTDMDVMPNCAPEIIGKVAPYPECSKRRWRAKSDFPDKPALDQRRAEIDAKATGQSVKTFVSDEWTLEYDLAKFGLAEEVYVAARSAKCDEGFDGVEEKEKTETVIMEFVNIKNLSEEAVVTGNADECSVEEVIASHVYALFTTGTKASKAITAQYLANILEKRLQHDNETAAVWKTRLPDYLIKAIEYVTGGPAPEEPPIEEVPSDA